MKIASFAVALVVAAVTPNLCLAAAPADYLKGPALFSVTVSADGKQLAYATLAGPDNHIIVQTIDDRKPVADINVGTQRIAGVEWAGSDHIIIYSIREDNLPGFVATYADRTYARAFNLKTRKMVELSMRAAHALSYVTSRAAVHEVDGATMAMIEGQFYDAADEHHSVSALYDVNLDTGETRLVDRGVTGFADWQANPAGLLLAKVEGEGKLDAWSLKVRQGEDWKEIRAGNGDNPYFVGLTGNGLPLVVIRRGEAAGVKRLETNGTLTDIGPIAGYSGVVRDEPTQRVQALVYRDGAQRSYRFLDKADQARWEGVQQAYPGQPLVWESASADHRRLVVQVQPPKDTPYYAFVDIAAGKSRVLGDIYPALKTADVAGQSVVSWKGAEGLPLQGVLTRARDAKAGDKTPLIIYAPPSVEPPVLGYGLSVQAFAAAGYSVFEPAHRGMSDTLDAGFGQKAMTDIAEGVKAVIATGSIDAKRICILSFTPMGGYTVLSALIHDPDLYQCGVDEDGGMLDIRELDRSTPGMKYVTRTFGIDPVNDTTTTAISPARNAGLVKAKVLFSQPEKDKSVYVEQARTLAKAIQRAGGKATSVEMPGDGEVRMSEAGRVKRFQTTLDFLKQAIP